METTVIERIKAIIFYLKISDRKFCEIINVPASTISNYFKRGSEPSLAVIQSILSSFEYIDPEWLILGKGEMIRKIQFGNNNQSNFEMLKMISDLSGENALLKKELFDIEQRLGYIAAEKKAKYGNKQ